jgi:hypothetical protein
MRINNIADDQINERKKENNIILQTHAKHDDEQ